MSVIRQSVQLAASPRALYETYLDSRRHGEAVGGRASIDARPGGRFWVFAPDAVRGRILHLVPGRLIVSTWRGQTWKDEDLDSVLTLSFTDSPKGGRIELTQALVPARAVGIIKAGWRGHYWRPWKASLGR